MCDMVHNTSPSSEIVLCEVLLRNIDTRRGYLEIWIKLLKKTLENKRSNVLYIFVKAPCGLYFHLILRS